METIDTRKMNASNIIQCSKCLRQLSHLNITDSLIFPLIFFFLSWREKAHDNKEFSHENSKPCDYKASYAHLTAFAEEGNNGLCIFFEI